MTDFNLRKIEKKIILEALKYYEGHRVRTAKSLGITTRTLYTKLVEYGKPRYLIKSTTPSAENKD